MDFNNYISRLKAIIAERDTNLKVFKASGWEYFNEFEPLIQMALVDMAAKVEPCPMKPAPKAVTVKPMAAPKSRPVKVKKKKLLKVKVRKSR